MFGYGFGPSCCSNTGGEWLWIVIVIFIVFFIFCNNGNSFNH